MGGAAGRMPCQDAGMEKTALFGYGTRVKMSDGNTGMVVGHTTRTYRIIVDGDHSGPTNYGRNFGREAVRGYRFADVERVSA